MLLSYVDVVTSPSQCVAPERSLLVVRTLVEK